MIDSATLENLLHMSEGDTIDFKGASYPLNEDHEKGAFIKDVLAFANGWRTGDAFILTGVLEPKNGNRAVILGVTGPHPDDADLQQLVNGRMSNPITFQYFPTQVDGKSIGVIRIPAGQDRPFWLKKSIAGVLAEKVYIRRGSTTDIADPAEIAKMGQARIVQGAPRILPETLADDFRRKRVRALNPMDDSLQGKFYVHVVPAAALQPGATIDLAPWGNEKVEPMNAQVSAVRRFTDEGVQSEAGRAGRLWSYALVLRNGAIEAGMEATHDVKGNCCISPWMLEAETVEYLERLLPQLQTTGVTCPVFVMLTLRFLGYPVFPPAPLRGWTAEHAGYTKDEFFFPPMTLNDLRTDDLPSKLHATFDHLWQAAGVARSWVYDNAGVWQGRKFDW